MLLQILTPIDPPYTDRFDIGIVYTMPTQHDRKHILLLNCSSGLMTKSSYARYLVNTDRVKRGLPALQQDQHVDHVNNNPADDRLDNYQILSIEENSKKYWREVFRTTPVSQEQLELLKIYIEDGYPYKTVLEKLGVTPMHLRYLISEYLPEQYANTFAERNLLSIGEQLAKGLPQRYVGFIHGLDHFAMNKFVKKHLPEFTRDAVDQERIVKIKPYADQDASIKFIAKKMGLDRPTTTNLIRKYIPEYLERRSRREAAAGDRNRELVENVKTLVEQKYTYDEIAQHLDISYTKVRKLIRKLPDCNRDGKLQQKINAIRKALDENMTRKEICAMLGVDASNLYNTIQKYFPEIIRKKSSVVDSAESIFACG